MKKIIRVTNINLEAMPVYPGTHSTKRKIFLNIECSGLHRRVSVSFTESAQIFGNMKKDATLQKLLQIP